MLFLDTSALLKRYVDEDGTQAVLSAMADDDRWAASALARVETELALCRTPLDENARTERRHRVIEDWDRFVTVPVDADCLAQATAIGCAHHIRTLDAIHLAAATRMPEVSSFITFDRRQAAAARAVGFRVSGVEDVDTTAYGRHGG